MVNQKIRCARAERSLLFDLFRAFDREQSQIRFFLQKRPLFSFPRAKNVLSYHLILVSWSRDGSDKKWKFFAEMRYTFHLSLFIEKPLFHKIHILTLEKKARNLIFHKSEFDYMICLRHTNNKIFFFIMNLLSCTNAKPIMCYHLIWLSCLSFKSLKM